MRIAFKDGTVHECTRVAFVGVAADIFLICGISLCEHPLASCREACAAAAAKSRIKKDFNDVIRGHFRQNFSECLIAARSDVFIDILRVDDTAVPKGDTMLLLIEVRII
jgi:hypothetical protein